MGATQGEDEERCEGLGLISTLVQISNLVDDF